MGEIPRSGARRATCHRGFWQAPLFSQPIAIRLPGVSFHDGFWFADLVSTDGRPAFRRSTPAVAHRSHTAAEGKVREPRSTDVWLDGLDENPAHLEETMDRSEPELRL